MAIATEHKTVQSRILAYAQEAGRTSVSRAEAEARSGFGKSQIKAVDSAWNTFPALR